MKILLKYEEEEGSTEILARLRQPSDPMRDRYGRCKLQEHGTRTGERIDSIIPRGQQLGYARAPEDKPLSAIRSL